ncbi:SMP-30/gluconolactonase/LRE family protein [Sphingomonas sp. BK580]|uniref:SMP-30/gluconolactonase/LRE family protein n=1 Tax=Sphingomonas sp. BK580 TaxID=2586972 RepID=UPI0016185199|nr:SMP-30/gluconolactonase/LRE family protein [Sphingomonas sp. BK580]MBB3695248.1 sugar lactone lactonase YvrE [Sphingomonas sp. BK580]
MTDVRILPRERRDALGEGLLWSPSRNSVFWVDIVERLVNRLDLADESVATWQMPDTIGWLIERERGGFVAGVGRTFVTLSLDPLELEIIADPEPRRRGNRFNDAKADAAGRIWAGSMPASCQGPSGAFYRLDPDGRVTQVDDGYVITNGPAIGSGFLLHTDSPRRTIYRYALHDDGSLGPRLPFIEFEDGWGNPDGMCFDAEGHLWVACWGAASVARFDPSGRRERVIPMPTAQVTNVAFAGAALDRMFVTSEGMGDAGPHSGCLFEVDANCRGVPPCKYAG